MLIIANKETFLVTVLSSLMVAKIGFVWFNLDCPPKFTTFLRSITGDIP